MIFETIDILLCLCITYECILKNETIYTEQDYLDYDTDQNMNIIDELIKETNILTIY